MPVPRIFVSSTCYDLQEIRYNLRDFIKSFAYEPVMSEFGDIFFDYKDHVQDACINEIKKCQMYILIIGNNYGSAYYKQQSNKNNPDSITLQEFRKSLEMKLPKHIFVNRFVNYDYNNYKRALDCELKRYFEKNEVSEENIKEEKDKIVSQFNNKYYFPHESYKHIFRFLDAIYELQSNNAVLEFENVVDIQNQLKQQWAYYMYERLSDMKDESASKKYKIAQDELSKKIDSIGELIKSIKPIDEKGTFEFDVDKYVSGMSYSKLSEIQHKVDNIIDDILGEEYDLYNGSSYLTTFREKIKLQDVLDWLNSLEGLLKKFKWSSKIKAVDVWKGFNIETTQEHITVEYKSLLELNAIYKSVHEGERKNFAGTIKSKLDNCVYIKNQREYVIDNDEMPF